MKERRISLRYIGACVFQAAFVTTLAFCLAALIVQPLSFSVMSVFSAPEKNDFSVTDLYAQVADRRPVSVLDPDVVLVDIGTASRSEIAEALHIIAMNSPAAVGVDVMFSENRGGQDDALLQALADLPGCILPVSLAEDSVRHGKGKTFHVADSSYFMGSGLPLKYAAANLPGKYEGATIREFSTGFTLSDGRHIDSFPVAVAAAASPEAVKELHDRNKPLEIIDFPSREYVTVGITELAGRGKELAGKIVLVGAKNDANDMHSTPIHSFMSGLSIHAAAVSTILDGRYYDTIEKFPDWLPACVLCFFILLLREFAGTALRGMVVRILQLLIVYFAVRVGYSLYVDHHIIFDFSYTMLMMMFGLCAADIWAGLRYLGPLIFKRTTNKITRLVTIWKS